MNKPDYKHAKAEANKILENCSIINPPILPDELAESYGIKIQLIKLDKLYKDVAGFFDFKEEIIYVNADDPYNRRTFTIAHELGHFFLHKKHFIEQPEEYRVLLRRPIGANSEPREQEANVFAANLLVPKKFLDRYRELSSIEDLASLFAVSEEVIRNRVKSEYGK